MVHDCCGAEVRSSTFNDMAREFVRLAASLVTEAGGIESIQSTSSANRCAAIVALLLIVLLVCGVFWWSAHRRLLQSHPKSKFVYESSGSKKNK